MSNLPSRNRGFIDELFDLQVGRFGLEHGSLLLNETTYPFTLRGHDLKTTLKQNADYSSYELILSSGGMLMGAPCCRDMPVDIATQATLRRNLIQFSRITLRSGDSKVQADGTLTHFSDPQAKFDFTGTLTVREAARVLGIEALRNGSFALRGTARYDREQGASAYGRLQAKDMAYSSRAFTFRSVDLVSDFRVARSGLTMDQIAAKLLGGTFSGGAALKEFRTLTVTGRVSALSTRAIAESLLNKQVPWNALVSGPVTASANLLDAGSKFSLRSVLELTAASGGIPLFGHVSVSKPLNSGFLFDESQLALPNTRVAFQGSPETGLKMAFDSTNLSEIRPVLPRLADLPNFLPGGSVHFSGMLRNLPSHPVIVGTLTLGNFEIAQLKWDQVRWTGTASSQYLDMSSLEMDSSLLHASGRGYVELHNWQVLENSAVGLNIEFRGVDLPMLLSECCSAKLPIEHGIASGTINISGFINRPAASGHIVLQNLSAYGQKFRKVEADAMLSGNEVQLKNGTLEGVEAGVLHFSGDYARTSVTWNDGRLSVNLDSREYPLSNLVPGLNGDLEIQTEMSARIAKGVLRPLRANGNLGLHNLTVSGLKLGDISAHLATENQELKLALTGDLRESNLRGDAEVSLTPANDIRGDIRFDRISLAAVYGLLNPAQNRRLPFAGFAKGGISFQGPLEDIALWQAKVDIDQLAVSSPNPGGYELRNARPILLDCANGTADLRSFELAGDNTSLKASGSFGYSAKRALNLNVNGNINLQLLRLLDPSLESSGQSQIKAFITGSLDAPSVAGSLEIDHGSLSSASFPNSFSGVNALIGFTNDRATIERLTAETGGGKISVGGFVALAHAGSLAYHLNARAEDVRVRYAGGISVTSNGDLRLTGTGASSLLSGTATISRVVFNPNTDLGSLLTGFAAATPAPANQEGFLAGVHLEIAIQSASNLQLSTALSRDVEAEIDLRLRGTSERPILLGSISANQGDIRVFGSRFSINRGEISFLSASKIDPVLDLNLQTQTRGIAVNIMISGTLNKLNIAYRSDPPLQPRDIIALLTVGRTPQEAANVQNTQVAAGTSTLPSSATTVLGQAISSSSGRLSKLFGITNIRIDPLIQGTTNTPESRLTLEQQISRSITVTYVTNLEQTSEQIFRLEWSINTQYSVVAVRDDNGEFGIDIQYKKRFR